MSEQTYLNIAVLTISDTRNEATDTSGHYLVKAATDAGHHIADKKIVIDDVYQIRAVISDWIADNNIHGIVSTGGTGFRVVIRHLKLYQCCLINMLKVLARCLEQFL